MKKIMDTKPREVLGRKAGRSGRKSYTMAEKLRIVEATMQPGVSVSRIAREHDINANLVFTWRRRYGRGELAMATGVGTGPLLPVLVDTGDAHAARTARTPALEAGQRGVPTGLIEIDLPGACIRVQGCVDGQALTQVLNLLRSR